MNPSPSSVLIACAFMLTSIQAASAQTYTFSTIAGTPGVPGSTNGSANQALFSGPAGLALDSSGNLYVAEDGNHTIRKLTPVGDTWSVTTIGGVAGQSGSEDGPLGTNRFYRPRGVAVDGSGTVFVADYNNSTIRRLQPSGADWIATTLAGAVGVLDHADGTSTNAFFNRPTGITVDPLGRLFVADLNNHVIRQIEQLGDEWSVQTIAGYPFFAGWSDGLGEEAEFAAPYGLVAANESTIYVADTGNNSIREMTQTAAGWLVSTIAAITNSPSGSDDGDGDQARFYFPVGIAKDNSGTLFVTDQLNHTVRKLTLSNSVWSVTTVAGKPREPGNADGIGADARFERPWGIAVDPAGNVYVADLRNHTIRKGVPSSGVARPTLAFLMVNGQLVLSWPLTADNFALETTDALSPGVWVEQIDGITTTVDSFEFAQDLQSPGSFFRLRQR